MDCNNRVSEQLNDYFSGHLTRGQEAEIENHLALCPACKETLETMRVIAADPTNDRVSGHLSTSLIASYYENPSTLPDADKDRIRTHLKQCDQCAYDYQYLRDMEEELTRSVKAEMESEGLFARLWNAIPVVVTKPAFAYFLLALTIYPAAKFVSDYVRTPQVSEISEQYQSYELTPANRSAGKATMVTRPESKATVRLTIPQYHSLDNFHYSYRIQTVDLAGSFQAEFLSTFENAGSIDLLANLRNLPDGDYVLTIEEIDREDPSDTSLTHYSIQLITDQP